jgi:mRNA interferase MazF
MINTTKTIIYVKRFNVWTKLKRKVHNYNGSIVHCKPREVWWVSLGHNVGLEQDGKGDNFERPVLIMKVYNASLFFGIPLTSKEHEGKYFYKIEYNGIPSIAVLSQARAFSSKRLLNKVGVVPIDMYNSLKQQYIKSVLDLDIKIRP